MSTATGVIKGQKIPYPTQEVNPLEATFCLLKALRDEIREVRDMLEEERRARGCETADLAAQLQSLREAKEQRFEEVDNALEDLKADMLSRFSKLQVQLEEAVADKVVRFDKLEAKVDSESIDRKGMIQAVNKRIAQEASQWRVRAETSDREVKDHKREAEIHVNNGHRRHDDLREEVERIAAILRDNSMARDPFRHFSNKPALPALSTSAPSAPISILRPKSPIHTDRSFNRSCLGCAKCDSPFQREMNSLTKE